MKTQIITLFAFLGIFCYSCSTDATEEISIEQTPLGVYFPPSDSDEWETTSVTDLAWNPAAEQPLFDFLEANNTDAFIILKEGRIVVEKYFGDFTQSQNHTWNSAAKTLTSLTVGIAQKEGLLSITDSSSDYLGTGWSSLTPEQESEITVKNHLTMTTGLDYTVSDIFCTDANCLTYKNDPDTFWYYHNAPYTILDDVISGAVGEDFRTYFYSRVRDKIGMQGAWIKSGYNNLYFSTARSMARFGLLIYNEGVWQNETIFDDSAYFNAMINTSQSMNPAYGYLWWLNGKNSYRVPGSVFEFPGKLIPNAPDDLIAALGKNDQKIYVIPSEDLVIVRMGDNAGDSVLGPSSFDNALWEKINDLTD